MFNTQDAMPITGSQQISDTVIHMQPYALVIFGAWFVCWLVYECRFAANKAEWQGWKSNVKPGKVFVVFIFLFAVPELIGAYFTEGKGDTFSEFIWSFIEDGHARSVIGISIGLALPVRAATVPLIFAGYNKLPVRVIPWWLICAGLAGWLVQHFPELGTQG